MSRYNNFEDFMQSVINEADRKCHNRYGKSLTEPNVILGILGHQYIEICGMLGISLAAYGKKRIFCEYILPVIVKEIVQSYKSEFDNHKSETSYIDDMVNRVSNKLMRQSIHMYWQL